MSVIWLVLALLATPFVSAAECIEAAVALNRAQSHFHHLDKHLMNPGDLRREAGDWDGAQMLLDEGIRLVERADAARWFAHAAQDYESAGVRTDAARTEAAGL